MFRVNENKSCKPDWPHAAVFSPVVKLPTDTTHCPSQVVPLTIYIKHLDQMENLFSLPRSLVFFYSLPLHKKRAIKVRCSHMNYFPFFFPPQSFARFLILYSKQSVYLRGSFFSLPQASVVTHLSLCVLKSSLQLKDTGEVASGEQKLHV